MISDASRPRRRKYRPLDVKTWFEGFLRLVGWILVIILSVVSGGLFVFYELQVLNRHDADWRDISFDQRITNDINNRYHKNFLLAEHCCNPDPVYFPPGATICSKFPTSPPLTNAPWSTFGSTCKPLVMLECSDVRSAACNSTRQVLYNAVGLSPTTGTPYVNCLRAGRVRVGAEEVAAGRPITLVAYKDNNTAGDVLVISNPFEINATRVQEFVDQVAASVAPDTVSYVQPSVPLSSSIYLAGVSVQSALTRLNARKRGLRAPPPWNSVSNLWPWPGMNARCKNSAVFESYRIQGYAYITIPHFNISTADDAVITLTIANTNLTIGAWQVIPEGEPSKVVGASQEVQVSYLTGVQVAIGQVPLLGACDGWQFSGDPLDVTLSYSFHWKGSVESLQSGTTFGAFVNQVVSIDVRDVATPRPFQLPSYGGMWYIFFAFVMAFIWLVSNSLILFIIILVWWNIRSNKGLPPIIYRYMKKYRGW